MKTIAHHTCSREGGFENVLSQGPFLATHNPSESLFQFLGTGYYFWENNIDMAMVWGRVRYNNLYYVMAIELELLECNCFDLVGNRRHQLFLV